MTSLLNKVVKRKYCFCLKLSVCKTGGLQYLSVKIDEKSAWKWPNNFLIKRYVWNTGSMVEGVELMHKKTTFIFPWISCPLLLLTVITFDSFVGFLPSPFLNLHSKEVPPRKKLFWRCFIHITVFWRGARNLHLTTFEKPQQIAVFKCEPNIFIYPGVQVGFFWERAPPSSRTDLILFHFIQNYRQL